MGILEKFRSQPRWKHADPSVRAAAVYDIGADEGAVLTALARDDQDAKVRRAALARISDADVLGEALRTDPDPDVRGEALRQLVGLAAETDDEVVATQVVRQLAGARRVKEIGVIARESAHVGVQAVAVEALTDSRVLGGVSRHAMDAGTRVRAVARIADADELAQVALKSEHTDSAVAAFDRLIDPAAVHAVAQRARNKVAVRKAKARLRLLEDALQPPVPVAAAEPMSAEDRQRGAALAAEVEALTAEPDPAVLDDRLARARVAFAELQADTTVEEALEQRFEQALDGVRDAVAVREAERVAEAARRDALGPDPSRLFGCAHAPVPGCVPSFRGTRAASRPG
jgi:hypothetical protein